MNESLLIQLLGLPDTYVGEAPPGVNTCQWISLSSGTSKTFFGLKTINSPEYAIYVRDSSNQRSSERIQACFKKLQNWNDEQAALAITRLPTYIGKDEKHRFVYSFRVQFIIGG